MSVDFALGWIRSRLGDDRVADKVADTDAHGAAVNREEGLAALTQVVRLVGSPVDPRVLAQVLDMDVQRLRSCLRLLVANGVLTGSKGSYAIAAHEPGDTSLLPGTRELMHRRAADCLACQPPPLEAAQAARIARHYEAAGSCWGQAFQWWREATEARPRRR